MKRVSEDERIIEGLATSPEPDRMGDIVEPKGAQFKLLRPVILRAPTRTHPITVTLPGQRTR